MPVPGGAIETSTGTWTDIVQTMFNLETWPYLYERPIFRPFTDTRPTRLAAPGDVYTMTVHGKLPLATTALTENLDVDAVALPANRQFNVSLTEYGSSALVTRKLEKTAFTKTIAQDVGREIGINASDSIDKIYQTVLDGATNVAYTGTSGAFTLTNPGAALTNINSNAIATVRTAMRRRLSVPRFGNLHACVIHPDVAHDLMVESGSSNTWKTPHEQVDTMAIYNGVLGDYRGTRFVENTNCTVVAGSPNAYTTYFIDQEALVEVVSQDVQVVVGPQIDKLKRFHTVGWYALLGISRFRENAIQLLKTASSIQSLAFPAFDPKA